MLGPQVLFPKRCVLGDTAPGPNGTWNGLGCIGAPPLDLPDKLCGISPLGESAQIQVFGGDDLGHGRDWSWRCEGRRRVNPEGPCRLPLHAANQAHESRTDRRDLLPHSLCCALCTICLHPLHRLFALSLCCALCTVCLHPWRLSGNTTMRRFLEYGLKNDVLPDIISW